MSTPTILPDRLEKFEQPDFTLDQGGHDRFEDGHCATESADWLTGGEPCISPELRRLFQSLNDRWPDEPRQLLKPYVLRALGTKGDGKQHERQRILSEWLLHESLPFWMEKAGREEMAKRLRELPADLAEENVRRVLVEVRDEAWEARRQAREGLKERVRAELAKRGLSAYAAADAAAAAYDAAADAAAAAYAAADAYAAAAYDAAADAAAYDADAYAAAAYDAAADADAAKATPGQTYSEVYKAIRKVADEKLAPAAEERRQEALALLDRLLPPAPLIEVAA